MTKYSNGQTYIVRSYETCKEGTIKLSSLINLMEDAASINAANLGASIHDLQHYGYSWVLSRMQLKIELLPKEKEAISISTWPSGIDKYFTYRDYTIHGQNGFQICMATSTWVVFDLTNRKLVSIPKFIIDKKFVTKSAKLFDKNKKIKSMKF